MFDTIKSVFLEEGIHQVGSIPADAMNIINPHLFPKSADIKSCIIFLVPYKTEEKANDKLGVSIYARAMDYHLFYDQIFRKIIPKLEETFKGERFFGFTDHSPINEKLAAASAGLGIIGKNSLLINDEYGSFVFIGALLTTLSLPTPAMKLQSCVNCTLCTEVCPTGAITEHGILREKCLSSLSQKKEKTVVEKLLLKSNNTVWGCDICQNVCPLNKNKKFSELDFFYKNRLNQFSEKLIIDMPDEVFSHYAFAWRGKEVLLNNIRNLNNSLK